MKSGSDLKILLGKYVESGKDFYWEPVRAVNPHLLISGTSGSGKSQTLMTIISQYGENEIPVIIFDVHGEYEDLGDIIIDFRKKVRINPLNCPGETPMELAFEIRDIISQIFKRIGYVQKDLLYKAIIEAYKERGILPQETMKGEGAPDFDDVYSIILGWQEKNPKDRSLVGLISRLRPVFEFRIFSGPDVLSIPELLKPKIYVFDLSTMPSEEIQRLAVVFTMRKIWSYIYHIGTYRGIRLSIVLDEAYKYAFEGSPLIPILREGRKFGISVLLASQMLNDFPEAVTANVGTKVVLNVKSHNERRRAAKELGLKDAEELSKATKERFHALVSYLGDIHWIRVLPYFEMGKGKKRRRESLDDATYLALEDGAYLKGLLRGLNAKDLERSLEENLRIRHSLANVDLAMKILREGREGEFLKGSLEKDLKEEARSRFLRIKEEERRAISLLLSYYKRFGRSIEGVKGVLLKKGVEYGAEELEERASWAMLGVIYYRKGEKGFILSPFCWEIVRGEEINEKEEKEGVRYSIEDSLLIRAKPEEVKVPKLANSYLLKVEEFDLILEPYWICKFENERGGALIINGITGEVLEDFKERSYLYEVIKGKVYKGRREYFFPKDLKVIFPEDALKEEDAKEIARSYLMNKYGEEFKIDVRKVIFPYYKIRLKSPGRSFLRKISAYSGREIEDPLSYCPLHIFRKVKAYALCESCWRAFCKRHTVEIEGHYYCTECAKSVLRKRGGR